MTTIYLVNEINQEHLADVQAEMAALGAPTIRAIDGGDHLIAVEGSHRLRAAEQLGIPVNIEILDEDSTIDLDSLDWDDNGWFDERTIPVRDFIDRFTAYPFPSGSATAEIEVA